jgi:hypothetical protein
MIPLGLVWGCCLQVSHGGATGGSSTAGEGATSSSNTTGASLGSSCTGVYCAAFYQCDPGDGECKCGGRVCDSGNCDADSGDCLAGCIAGSTGALAIVSHSLIPSGAGVLPGALLETPYATLLECGCGDSPYNSWTNLTPLPPGMGLLRTGWFRGVPTALSDGGPFEFQVEVTDLDGGTAFQNFLFTVSAPLGP